MRICPNCQSNGMYGVMYAASSEHYHTDISEYQCPDCGSRYGRWTRKKLNVGEEEPVFGGAATDPEVEEIGEYTKPEIKEL